MAPELSAIVNRFMKFAGVGAVGTAGHYVTLFVLVSLLDIDAVVSSSAGFVVGGIINYLLNYTFTFRSRQSHVATAPKFFAIALVGFFLNGLVMSLLVNAAGIHYFISQVVSTGLILIWTFLANHYWTFGEATKMRAETASEEVWANQRVDLSQSDEAAYLIVNADDFGYFSCVSDGIVHAHREGVLTATAVFANSPRFEDEVGKLRNLPGLDIGVHLNLTHGVPLSPSLAGRLKHNDGHFTSKGGVVKRVMIGSVASGDIEEEWMMQIQRCLDAGLEIRFLNSHEHMHMLPQLFRITRRLADRFSIPHVRVSTPDPIEFAGTVTIVRDFPLALLSRWARASLEGEAPQFLGMGSSGRLSLDYLEKHIPLLRPGVVYELMCHPGFFDSAEITSPELLEYHDWRGELQTLLDPRFTAMLERYNVRLTRYRDLDNSGRIVF